MHKDPVLTPHGISLCKDCGVRLAPERSEEELRALYADEYFEGYDEGEDYALHAERRRYESRRRLDFVRAHVGAGRLLEIGAAGGFFLAAARDAGFDVLGIEPAPGMAESARREFGLDVRTAFLEDVELEPGSFDAVCAWHVLEHIRAPRPQLERVRELLRRGGALFVEVPNGASVQASRMGAAWPHWQFEHHVAHHSPRSLRVLLEGAGLRVADVHTFPVTGYFHPARALRPLQLANYVKEGLIVGAVPRRPHPERHELIRAVATRA